MKKEKIMNEESENIEKKNKNKYLGNTNKEVIKYLNDIGINLNQMKVLEGLVEDSDQTLKPIAFDFLPVKWKEKSEYIYAINKEIRKAAEYKNVELLNLGIYDNGYEILGLSVGSGKRTLLSITRIHGDELAGTNALLKMVEKYSNSPKNFRFLCIPLANPDAASKYIRYNFENKVMFDLNRKFELLRCKTTHILNDFVKDNQPDIIIDHHEQGYPGFRIYVPPNCKKSLVIAEKVMQDIKIQYPDGVSNITDEISKGNLIGYINEMYNISSILVETSFYLDLAVRVEQHCLAIDSVIQYLNEKDVI